jgi:hemolysin III
VTSPAQLTDSPLTPPQSVKPRLRGVFHQYAFFFFLASGLAIVAAAPTEKVRWAVSIYALTVVALFGVSALYHRITWPPRKRRFMRRLDHSMIFLLIAGTSTPFAVLVLSKPLSQIMLYVVWLGALAGICMKFAWIDAPRWLVTGIYLALGWAAVAAIPQIVGQVGMLATALLCAGGGMYTIGALIYAKRQPDPRPASFGYHEIFHLLVICAAGFHFAAIAFFLV